MQVLPLIRKLRRSEELTSAEIDGLVRGAVDGSVPDYQLAAWLMAVCYEHLTPSETLALTEAFITSGEQLDWSNLQGPVADKHSTGGVGDKATLIVAPWLAAAGVKMPKLSGRGLGHTGGTIDKLETIPGFETSLSLEQARRLMEETGCMVAGQSANLTPADKIFYALRDATDTVAELGLITASVMSKKIAAGAPLIVLDVKVGQGAFFTSEHEARDFAALAVAIGEHFERKVACVLSRMDQPLGRAVGNALEVAEVLCYLHGNAENYPDLDVLVRTLTRTALVLCETGESAEEIDARLDQLYTSGEVLRKFEAWVTAQGGDLAAFSELWEERKPAYQRIEVTADQTGYIASLDSHAIGMLAGHLGAGRATKDDRIDALVGIECLKKVGDYLESGETVAIVHAQREADAVQLASAYLNTVSIGRDPIIAPPIIIDVLGR